MFRVPRLTLTPPRPSYLGWICWKNIVDLEVQDVAADESAVSKTRMQREVDTWTAKLSDFDDPFTLAGCLWRISDGEEGRWQKYFRLAPRGQAFVWWFDNAKHSSNNPYFELLFRSLRKICSRLNGSTIDGGEAPANTADVDECKVCIREALKRLNPSSQKCHAIEQPVSVSRKPNYQDSSCAVASCPWLDPNFYTALFSFAAMKEAVEKIHADVTELIDLAQNEEERDGAKLQETFLQIHFDVTHLNDFTSFEKNNSLNPFSVYLPFISYLEEIQTFLSAVSTACNALLTKDVNEYEKTVTVHVDDYQPSLLRLLKAKGFALTSASSSGKCHESDRPRDPAIFVLFSNDKINCDQEDVKRQIELRNVLASYSSIPQIKRSFPKLKRVVFDDADNAGSNESNFVVVSAVVWRTLKRIFDCESVSFS